MSKNLVIIPTYNEAENIIPMLEKVHSLATKYHILVVDDNSPDGTAKLVQTHSSYNQNTFLLQRTEKNGLGRAYMAGFQWALEHHYEYIFEMDCDFSHSPDYLDSLLNKVKEGYDLVVGSRYVRKGKVLDWPFKRLFLSYGASLYARFVTGMPIKDPTAGFICYHRNTLEAINFNNVSSIGYSFQIEMKYAAWSIGKRLAEVPITFIDRVAGQSKMDSSIIKEAALGVIQIRKHKKGYYLRETQK